MEVKQRQAMGQISRAATHYEVLGIERQAQTGAIRAQFRMLSLLVHPDKNGAEGAREAFEKVQKAYESLSDQALRLEYDTSLDSKGGSTFWNHDRPATRSQPPPEVHTEDFYYSGYSGFPRLCVYIIEFVLTLLLAIVVVFWKYCLSWVLNGSLLVLIVSFHFGVAAVQWTYRILSWALFTARTASLISKPPRFQIYTKRSRTYLRDRLDWTSADITGMEAEVIFQLSLAGVPVEDATGTFGDAIEFGQRQMREAQSTPTEEVWEYDTHERSRGSTRRERRRSNRRRR